MSDETLDDLQAEQDEHEFDQAVGARARDIRINDEARHVVAVERAGREYPALSIEDDGLLSELVTLERQFEKPRIDGLMNMPHSVIIAASYKSGKTTMGLNVLKAAADGVPFLGRDVHMNGGRVGWLNGEMDRDDWLDYLAPMQIQNMERIAVRNMRGRRLNLMDDYVADEFVKWLKANEVEWWWVDSWRVLCAWSGVNENRNEEVELLTARVDKIKREADVKSFTALAHTGRAQVEDGTEHARGATALDDWQDVRWVLTRAGRDRFLYVEGRGRGVGLGESKLIFDEGTNLLSLGEGNRATYRISAGMEMVVQFVSDNPGCNAGDIRRHLSAGGITNANDQSGPINSARDQGLVHFKKQGTSHLYFAGPSPEAAEQQRFAANLSFEGTHINDKETDQ